MADSLSDSQQEALSQYLAVTQQDMESAVAVLRRSEWNVQLAISKFFDGEAAAPTESTAPPPPPAPSQPRTVLPRPTGAEPLTPAPRITALPDNTTVIRRPPLLLGLFFLPFSLLYRLLSSSFSLFAYIFPFLRPTLARSASASARKGLNPRDRAARYVRDFEECVSSDEKRSEEGEPGTVNVKLPWFEGGYAQALDKAKADMRFLLVVLTSDEHDDTTSFFRRTLANPDLATFLTTNDFILWGGRVSDSEAYQVSKALEVTTLPTSLLISFTPPNTRSTASNDMSVIARVQGALSPEAYISKLRSAQSAHQPHLDTIRQRRRANEDARRITEQSNSAYERSLANDQRRARERKEAEEAARRAEEERIAKEKEVEMMELSKGRWKKAVAREVWREMKEPEVGGVRIMVRMVDGKVFRRRLRPEVTLDELYRFVECREEVETLDREGEEAFADVELPTGYKHEYKFRIASVMPRKVYEPTLAATVGDLFSPSASLVVETEDDDEDDE